MKNRNVLLISVTVALWVALSSLYGGMARAEHADQVAPQLPSRPISGSSLLGLEATATERLQAASGKLPLSFVPNAGQMDPTVRFQVRSAGTTLFFTSNEIVLSLPTRTTADPQKFSIHVPWSEIRSLQFPTLER